MEAKGGGQRDEASSLPWVQEKSANHEDKAVGVGREDSELAGERVEWKGWTPSSSFKAECHTTSPKRLSLLLCAVIVKLDGNP